MDNIRGDSGACLGILSGIRPIPFPAAAFLEELPGTYEGALARFQWHLWKCGCDGGCPVGLELIQRIAERERATYG